MQVDVLLNRQLSSDPERAEAGCLAIFERIREDRYQPGDLLEKVASYQLPASDIADEVALENAFARYNRGSGLEVPAAEFQFRSLSCGDVVVINGKRAYACAPVGWTPVELG